MFCFVRCRYPVVNATRTRPGARQSRWVDGSYILHRWHDPITQSPREQRHVCLPTLPTHVPTQPNSLLSISSTRPVSHPTPSHPRTGSEKHRGFIKATPPYPLLPSPLPCFTHPFQCRQKTATYSTYSSEPIDPIPIPFPLETKSRARQFNA